MNATHECEKCSGTGRIKAFSHIHDGRCFKCLGAGQITLNKTAKNDRPEVKIKQITLSDDLCTIQICGDMLKICGDTGMILIDRDDANKGLITVVEVGDGWRHKKSVIVKELQQKVKPKIK